MAEELTQQDIERKGRAAVGELLGPTAAEKAGYGPAKFKELYEEEKKAKLAERQAETELEKTRRGELVQERARGEAEMRGIQERMGKEFAPTPATQGELVTLFGMLGAVGGLMGRGGYTRAIGAMNAMGGMLKGYNQGRKDLFEQEKSIFDKQLAENKARYERAANAAKIALEEAKVNLPKAMADLKLKLRQDGFELLAQRAEGEGLVKVYEKAEQLKNKATELYYRGQQVGISVQNLQFQKQKAANAPVSIIGEGGEPQLITQQEFERRSAAGEKITPAPRSGTTAGGSIQFRYNQAVQDAAVSAAMEIKNFADLPLRSSPPAVAEVITNPSKGLSDAARAYFSQSITKAEDRAQQQVSAGLIRQVATISASGRPGGVTEAAIKEYEKMLPKAGDKKINTFLFLGMMRQEMEVAVKHLQGAKATPEQISQAIAARDAVNEVVPFTTSDILRIMRQGGPALSDKQTQTIISQATKINEFEKKIGRAHV